MTLAVAVMNKIGVGLATDGAVTMSGAVGSKIYPDAEKLFCLQGGQPIGIMICGSAEFMDIPLETLIKMYARDLGNGTCATVDDYANSFLTFLRGCSLFSEELQRKVFRRTITRWLVVLRERVSRELGRPERHLGGARPAEIRDALRAVFERDMTGWEQAYQLLPDAPAGFDEALATAYDSEIRDALVTAFDDCPPHDLPTSQFARIVAAMHSRDTFRSSSTIPEETCNVIFAGFGEAEIFPAYANIALHSVCMGYTRAVTQSTGSVGFDVSSMVAPFAQREAMDTFLLGISPHIQDRLHTGIGRVVAEQLSEAFSRAAAAELPVPEILQGEIATAVNTSVATFLEDTAAEMRREYRDPVLDAIAAMPRAELAATAGAFVNLTSLRQKVAVAEETVSGATHVAVISKGDGFCWVNRSTS